MNDKLNMLAFIILYITSFSFLIFDINILTSEDGLIEYLSVFFWISGLVLAVLISIKSKNLITFILLLVCFIAIGEEISWGQRILNIETPDYLKTINKQSEINFHNLEIFSGENAWREFFKTKKINYHLLLDAQNIFRIGIVILFIIFPLLTKSKFLNKILKYLGYNKPPNYFTLTLICFLITSFTISFLINPKHIHAIQEIREMSYALFIAMYLFTYYQYTKIQSSTIR